MWLGNLCCCIRSQPSASLDEALGVWVQENREKPQLCDRARLQELNAEAVVWVNNVCDPLSFEEVLKSSATENNPILVFHEKVRSLLLRDCPTMFCNAMIVSGAGRFLVERARNPLEVLCPGQRTETTMHSSLLWRRHAS